MIPGDDSFITITIMISRQLQLIENVLDTVLSEISKEVQLQAISKTPLSRRFLPFRETLFNYETCSSLLKHILIYNKSLQTLVTVEDISQIRDIITFEAVNK